MNLAAKITTGVAVLVVGGLVAIAVPTVSGAYAEMSSWAIFHRWDEDATEESTDEPASAEEDPIGKKMIDELGDGYVYVGNGTAIPKDTPEGCENPVWLHIGRDEREPERGPGRPWRARPRGGHRGPGRPGSDRDIHGRARRRAVRDR